MNAFPEKRCTGRFRRVRRRTSRPRALLSKDMPHAKAQSRKEENPGIFLNLHDWALNIEASSFFYPQITQISADQTSSTQRRALHPFLCGFAPLREKCLPVLKGRFGRARRRTSRWDTSHGKDLPLAKPPRPQRGDNPRIPMNPDDWALNIEASSFFYPQITKFSANQTSSTQRRARHPFLCGFAPLREKCLPVLKGRFRRARRRTSRWESALGQGHSSRKGAKPQRGYNPMNRGAFGSHPNFQFPISSFIPPPPVRVIRAIRCFPVLNERRKLRNTRKPRKNRSGTSRRGSHLVAAMSRGVSGGEKGGP
jgi:hypothetical protein